MQILTTRTLTIAALTALSVASPFAQGGQPSTAAASGQMSPEHALVAKYCVTCHNEKRKIPAGSPLLLDQLDIDRVEQNPAVWEKVVLKVGSGAMPPAGMPRPDAQTFDAWLASLQQKLDAAAATHPNVGRPAPVHRLNRAEYTNAIRDLLALDVDGRALLPPDDAGYGFDNIGDVLSVSPGLMERYMLAAAKISRQVVGDPTLRPATAMYKTSPYYLQSDRAGEDLPFGSRGGLAVRHHFPLDGEYEFNVTLTAAAPEPVEIRIDRTRVKLFPAGEHQVNARLQVKAGTRLVSASFIGAFDTTLPIDGRREFPIAHSSFRQIAVSNFQIVGPYGGKVPQDVASRRKIFVCHPPSPAASAGQVREVAQEKACAKQILSTLARRAYRRPVTDADVAPLLAVYERGRAKGDFESGIRWGVEAVLVSPKFLFRVEQDPAGRPPNTPYQLSDVDLASRLSFFLWSSIPDDELLSVAEKGTLHRPTVLEQQVRRMLADERSKSLITNFVGQWLYLRNVRLAAPDTMLFPDFDDNLREAFQRETELFLQDQLRGDHPLVDLLTANYTFVNQRLAEHYGIPNVYGSHFRKVPLPDSGRAGLLGQGSILLVTSEPNRTSPVKRGKWLLENILGAPPPPPPPNVPALKENGEGAPPATVRARMELHRKNPVCATCHSQIDPPGFALENFDAIGRWRDADGEAHTPIDASGTLVDGTKFNGPAQFREVLLKRQRDFVRTVSEKLMTYALGRGLEASDAPLVRQLLREAGPSQYRWSALVLGIVKSRAFQQRMTSPPVAELGQKIAWGN